jgi:carboxypeptidase Q
VPKARSVAAIVFAAHLVLAPALRASAQEPVDLAEMTRIRDEGFNNSKVMDTLEYLTDVIGPRLTGSPALKQANDWTKTQLETWGLKNAHLEQWGPFGRGWTLERVSVNMVTPEPAPLIAIPKAWTPGTNGPVRGKVVHLAKAPENDADLEQYKGKLAGAIVFVGDARDLKPLDKPLSHRYTDKELEDLGQFEISDGGPRRYNLEAVAARIKFQKVINQFMIDEKALAVVQQSPWDRGVVLVQSGGSYHKGEPVGVPSLVMAAEQFNRICRIVDHKMDVELEVDVRASFTDDEQMAYNTVAEIPGTDKKDEVVIVGAHLDSWHSGTGETDNAAGCAAAMEAIRILQAIGVKPRRTIRVVLWTGEEQGLIGSRAYVDQHFASRPEPTDPEQKALPAFLRKPTGPLTIKPEHARVSAYFNLDNGTGKIRGVYAQQNAAVVPIFQAWLAPFADLGATTVTMRDTGSTDHISFDRVGLPGFQFIQDDVEYSDFDNKGLTHHSNMDVYDHAEREDLMQASVIMAAFLYDAAMRPEMMPRKALPKDQ